MERPTLSEIAGAGDRLSLQGLHETGDERFDGSGCDRNQEIGLNLVTGFCTLSACGQDRTEAPLEGAGAASRLAPAMSRGTVWTRPGAIALGLQQTE
jgi:hypothetical protein